MSSHDNTFDGGMALGEPGRGGQVAIGDPQSDLASAQAGAAGGLTLDEAENIAALRLQELAIRLSDDDAESVDDEPSLTPFDADRHLRTRLARRLARLGSDDDADDDARSAGGAEPRVRLLAETGVCARYVVSEALPLTAFGDGLAALSYGRLALPALAPPAQEEASADAETIVEPAVVMVHEPAVRNAGDAVPAHVLNAEREPELRLVDLIREQRELLDRLGRFGDEAATLFGTTEAGLASGPADVARSDAEELFEAGTYAPESAHRHGAADEEADRVSISAEQLIAALKEATPQDEEIPEPAADLASPSAATPVASNLMQELVDRDREVLPHVQYMLHRPSRLPAIVNGAEYAPRPLSGLALDERAPFPVQDLATDPSPERAPIIIERARAEMTALANGTGPLLVSQPSAAIGFFAGLSLSLVCGVALYFVL